MLRQAEGDDSEAYEEPYAERDQAGYSQQPDEPRGPPLDLLSPLVPNPGKDRPAALLCCNKGHGTPCMPGW